MQYFRKVHEGLDVAPMLAEIDAQSGIWDRHKERTAGGPMAGTSDCWLRYWRKDLMRSPSDYLCDHGRMEFYPEWHKLPALHGVAYTLMSLCRGIELGTCLLSRIPPGGTVGMHNDGAAWSARYFRRKFYCILRANPECENVTLDESVVMPPGSIFEFDNLVDHAVFNRGTTERINLIVTLRDEP
jgi:hypothetical protein